VTDAITDFFFTTSETANANLRRSGVPEGRIFFVGNTMIDTLLHHLPQLRPPAFWDEFRLVPRRFLVLTLHRPANVDAGERLVSLLTAVSEAARDYLVVFPVHPRTRRQLTGLGLPPVARAIRFVDPQGYLEFNYLVRDAAAVITDSGGITEEATVMGVPCLSLRDTTERPETITIGTNELIGTDPSRVKPALDRVFAGTWKKGGVPPLWDGKTSERIVGHLERLLSGGRDA